MLDTTAPATAAAVDAKPIFASRLIFPLKPHGVRPIGGSLWLRKSEGEGECDGEGDRRMLLDPRWSDLPRLNDFASVPADLAMRGVTALLEAEE